MPEGIKKDDEEGQEKKELNDKAQHLDGFQPKVPLNLEEKAEGLTL